MPHALDTSLWATVTYLYTEVENPPTNKIRLNVGAGVSGQGTDGWQGHAQKRVMAAAGVGENFPLAPLLTTALGRRYARVDVAELDTDGDV